MLKLLNSGRDPLGQFDGYDYNFLTLKGGEVVTFASMAVPSTDLAAYDSFDGYMNPSGTRKRTVVTRTLVSGSRPLMLADDGIAGYGTLFGSVIGGTVGQDTTGTALGPHTAYGSGKVTCWDKPGLYAVSLDACDTDVTNGLQPTNTSLDAGAALTYTSTGLLCTVASSRGVGGAPTIARFVEFDTNGALVNTPTKLVTAAGLMKFTFATFWFSPPSA